MGFVGPESGFEVGSYLLAIARDLVTLVHDIEDRSAPVAKFAQPEVDVGEFSGDMLDIVRIES
jgi:hypothetical protein